MLKTRILTAIVGLPLLIGAIYMGGWTTHIFFTLLAVLGVSEFFFMMKKQNFHPMFLLGILTMIAWTTWFYRPADLAWVLTAFLLTLVVISVMRFPDYSFDDVALNFTGIFYIGFLINFAILFNYHRNSFLILLLAFLVAWSNDTGGYFVGRMLGKHKLAPQLSPKKTWEGALGGLLTAALVIVLFFKLQDIWKVDYYFIATTAILASIAGQIGDLMISSMKRYFDVKDSSKLIPGHGGILDRFDSFLLILPVLYYLMVWFEIW